MKKLALLAVFAPSTLLAHGTHAPVPEALHGMAHTGVAAGLSVIAVAIIAALVRRFRS